MFGPITTGASMRDYDWSVRHVTNCSPTRPKSGLSGFAWRALSKLSADKCTTLTTKGCTRQWRIPHIPATKVSRPLPVR
jgi:hypothetical protein